MVNWSQTTSSATASAPPRFARSSTPLTRSSPTILEGLQRLEDAAAIDA
jgi:hypothetical protein